MRSGGQDGRPDHTDPLEWRSPVALRLAAPSDDPALRRLAELDSRRLPPGPHLIAVREGRVDAALSLATGEVVADPFRQTVELVELLRCHAGARTGDLGRRSPSVRPLARLAAT
ncbi:MAG: hypothetical protein ACRDM7_02420 [Thermoleophilaceae bacterium]